MSQTTNMEGLLFDLLSVAIRERGDIKMQIEVHGGHVVHIATTPVTVDSLALLDVTPLGYDNPEVYEAKTTIHIPGKPFKRTKPINSTTPTTSSKRKVRKSK